MIDRGGGKGSRIVRDTCAWLWKPSPLVCREFVIAVNKENNRRGEKGGREDVEVSTPQWVILESPKLRAPSGGPAV